MFFSLNISNPCQPSSRFLSSLLLDREGECVGRHLAVWGRWGSRPVPRECGILIWAICNDRPPMSTEEWQVERLWQVLIAVRKSSWRMCQLSTALPFLSSSIAVILYCLSVFLCVPFDLCLLKVSELTFLLLLFCFLFPLFLYFGWHSGVTTCQHNLFLLLPFLPPHPFIHPFSWSLLLGTVVDIKHKDSTCLCVSLGLWQAAWLSVCQSKYAKMWWMKG